MPALTPIERAVATYCPDWTKAKADQAGFARVNVETLGNATPPDFKFRYIDITSVNEGAIDWGSVARIRFADSPSRARRVVRQGDTMICTVRPLLPVPTPDEQASLVKLAAAVDGKIDALGRMLTAQAQLKKSLMHDLLTGRVRLEKGTV